MRVLGELEAFRLALGHRLEDEESQEALRFAGPATEELRSRAGGRTMLAALVVPSSDSA